MVNLTIDNINVSVPEGTTIMDAAKMADIPIPKLCYLKDINEIAACRVCVVELEGMERLVTSCNNVVKEGMVIHTNSPKVRTARRQTVQLILSQHDCKCATCVRSGNCTLQSLANDLNIIEIPFKQRLEEFPWDKEFPLIRDSQKCIKCMRCIQVCDKIQDLHIWDVTSTGSRTTINVTGNHKISEVSCSLCGQCITHCPVGALRERDDTEKVWDAIADDKKVVVAQVAPAVRAAWGEALGLSREEATVGKIMDALKKMGIDYVFDTSFTADLTIMEEGNEFLQRFTKGELNLRPMFTSCCPGWVRFLKSQYPHLVPQLSTAKSPQQMFGSVMKSYFAESIGVKPENMFTVSIMPCVAKKGESNMELFYGEYAGHETDVVLTTRELTRMIRSAHIDPASLVDRECDPLMKEWTGAGVIFGTTGGVMEAALRSAHYLVTGRNPDPDAFKIVRNPGGQPGVVEAEIQLGDATVRAAVVSGLGNTRKLIEAIEHGEVHYDFVEVMACPGGCVGGGGQPIHDGEELARTRGENLYFLDKNAPLRFSHENPDVLRLYRDFFEKPDEVLITKQTKKSERVLDIKPLIYGFQVTDRGGVPSFYLKLSTGSTDNLKPELVLEALFLHMGLTYDPNAIQIHRKDVYASDGTDVEDLERVTEDGAVEITCSFTQEYLEEAWENQVAQVEKSYAFYEKSGADGDAVKTAALSVQQHKQAHYEDMTATYVIDENQILRSMEYQITLIMPEITQDLSGNKMLGKDRKMQIMVTAEVDRYNQGGIANKVQQYKTLVQEYME